MYEMREVGHDAIYGCDSVDRCDVLHVADM